MYFLYPMSFNLFTIISKMVVHTYMANYDPLFVSSKASAVIPNQEAQGVALNEPPPSYETATAAQPPGWSF